MTIIVSVILVQMLMNVPWSHTRVISMLTVLTLLVVTIVPVTSDTLEME